MILFREFHAKRRCFPITSNGWPAHMAAVIREHIAGPLPWLDTNRTGSVWMAKDSDGDEVYLELDDMAGPHAVVEQMAL